MQRAIPFFAVVQSASWILRPQYFNPPKLFRRRFYWALGTGRLCNAVNLLGHAEKTCVLGTLEMELSGRVQSADCGCVSGSVSGTLAVNPNAELFWLGLLPSHNRFNCT